MTRRLDLNDAVVLITGAGAGIGRAIADDALRRGARVIAIDRDISTMETRDRLTIHQCDSSDAEGMRAIVAQTLETHGKLDVAIANAGIERIDPMWRMSEADFEAVIEVNILGVYRTLKPCLDPVIASGGHLLAMSSIAGLVPFPFGAAYSSSKAAVDIMMRILRMELLGTGASAGAAYFGFISSDMGDRVTGHPGVQALSRWMPKRLLGLTPILPPEIAARRVLDAIEKRKARTYTPGIIALTYALRGLYSQSDDLLGRHIMRLPDFIADHYGAPGKNERQD